jgi:hypothetical protein
MKHLKLKRITMGVMCRIRCLRGSLYLEHWEIFLYKRLRNSFLEECRLTVTLNLWLVWNKTILFPRIRKRIARIVVNRTVILIPNNPHQNKNLTEKQ